jgi:DtxR family Mn-dependent transcriptional regulator
MASEYMEEYLETLYTLTEGGMPAKTSEIATQLKVAPASVTEMLQKLADEGYATYKPYYGATLTKKGFDLAKKIKRKHRLLERFLFDTLKIKKDRIHEQACRMEHVLSDEAEEALCKVLNHPDECPDDSRLIPPCEKDVPSCAECERGKVKRSKELVPITKLQARGKGRVAFIRGEKNVTQRLSDMGLTKDAEVCVLKSAPMGGPVEVSVRGSKIAVGHELANKVFVELCD